MFDIYGYKLNNSIKPMLNEISSLIKQKENAILLVPEHYTLQAEKDLMYGLNLNGLFNIEVLSPTRLETRILESNPKLDKNMLDISGEAIALSIIAEKNAGELKYYRDCFNDGCVFPELVRFINTIHSANISLDQVGSYIISLTGNGLNEKWNDIYKLYEQYLMLDQNKYKLGSNKNNYIQDSLKYYNYIKGNNIVVYGFDALSSDLIELLVNLSDNVKSIKLFLAIQNSQANDYKIYKLMKESLDRLCTKLKYKNIKYRFTYNDDIDNSMPDTFKHLLNVLYSKPSDKQIYNKSQNNIKIIETNNQHDEVNFVCDEIENLYRNIKVELSKIAIFLPNNSGYEFILDSALNKRRINFYNAESFSLKENNLAKYILLSLRSIAENATIEDIYELLSSPLSILNLDETSFLRNYIYEHGILYGNINKAFKRGKDSIRVKAEELRTKFITPLFSLKLKLTEAENINDMLDICLDYINTSSIYSDLINDKNTLYNIGMSQTSEQLDQIITAISNVFEQISIIVKNEKISIRKLADYLEYGLSMVDINVLPPVKNSIIVGALDHILVNDIDYLFILGFNDGFLNSEASKLFSDYEIQKFSSDIGVFFSLSADDKSSLNSLHIKKALTLSKNKLYISYSTSSLDGEDLYQNTLVSELCSRFFIDLSPVAYIDRNASINKMISDYKKIFLQISNTNINYKDKLKELAVIRENLLKNGYTESEINELILHKKAEKLKSDNAQKLFYKNSTSVSKLESYAQCPFKYFIDYGIKPKIIEAWEQNAKDTGTFYHSIMEDLSNEIKKNPDIFKIDDNLIDEKINSIINNNKILEKENPYTDTKRNSTKFDNEIKNTILFSAKAYLNHMKNSNFTTDKSEMRFGDGTKINYTLNLDNGTKILLNGSIDRVDICEDTAEKYLRIIDYKSSEHKLDPSKLYYGLQLQLMMYLNIALEYYKGAIPAGAFYFHIDLPWADKENDNMVNKLKMQGIILRNLNAIANIDKDPSNPSNTSKILKIAQSSDDYISINGKKYTFASCENVLEDDKFKILLNHIEERAKHFANQISKGNIEVLPINLDENKPCKYCDYQNICLVGNKSKVLEKLDFNNLFDKI